jgi:Domain of unknown function (DU1801)
MTDEGRRAALAHIEGLDEPRRSQVRHLHEVILDALPGIDVSMWEYGGTLIGYGSYDYSNSRGPAGRWFSVGLASRKGYISLFSMGNRDGGYLVEAVHDRFPGTKIGRSCLNITRPELIDDEAVRDLARETWAQYREGFRRPERTRPS